MKVSTKRPGGKGCLIFEDSLRVRLAGDLCCDGEQLSFVNKMENGSVIYFHFNITKLFDDMINISTTPNSLFR